MDHRCSATLQCRPAPVAATCSWIQWTWFARPACRASMRPSFPREKRQQWPAYPAARAFILRTVERRRASRTGPACQAQPSWLRPLQVRIGSAWPVLRDSHLPARWERGERGRKLDILLSLKDNEPFCRAVSSLCSDLQQTEQFRELKGSIRRPAQGLNPHSNSQCSPNVLQRPGVQRRLSSRPVS